MRSRSFLVYGELKHLTVVFIVNVFCFFVIGNGASNNYITDLFTCLFQLKIQLVIALIVDSSRPSLLVLLASIILMF